MHRPANGDIVLAIQTPLMSIIGSDARSHSFVANAGRTERSTGGSARLRSTAPISKATATPTTFAPMAVVGVRKPDPTNSNASTPAMRAAGG